MIEKHNIEAFLKVNGIPPTAKDEEIRSVLISARWNDDEVDTALMVLKENTKNQQTHVDTLHKVFNTDSRLNAAEISSLLGIDVVLSSDDVNNITEKHYTVGNYETWIAFFLSIFVALSSVGYLIYSEQNGNGTSSHTVPTTKTTTTKVTK